MIKSLHLLCALAIVAAMKGAEQPVRIEVLKAPPAKGQEPFMPFLEREFAYWKEHAPLFDLKDGRADFAVTGWGAVTKEAVLFHIVVYDPIHVNHDRAWLIGHGDHILIGLEPGGDIAAKQAVEKCFISEEGYWSLALTDYGPQTWPSPDGDTSYLNLRIIRDEAKKTTTYDVAIPWSELGAAYGATPELMFGFRAADCIGEGVPTRTLEWAKVTGFGPRHDKLKPLRLGNPTSAMCVVQPVNNEIWQARDTGEFIVGYAGDAGPVQLSVSFAGRDKSLALPAARLADGFHRWRITIQPGKVLDRPVEAIIKLTSGDAVIHEETVRLQPPRERLAELFSRLDELIAQAPNELVARTFRSVRAIAATQWEAAMAVADRDLTPSRKLAGYIKRLRRQLPQKIILDDYLTNKRPFIGAVLSDFDQTLQPYVYHLPRNWDPQQAYPLIVELHGAMVDPHPLDFAIREIPELRPPLMYCGPLAAPIPISKAPGKLTRTKQSPILKNGSMWTKTGSI